MLDPRLVGPKAFEQPVVREWWDWLREEYTPEHPVALVTPCSSVKPYTDSPTSRTVRSALQRLGLWSYARGRPLSLVWLYFSGLLILVPYERAVEYPACCYELGLRVFEVNDRLRQRYVEAAAQIMERLVERGLRKVLVYLPRRHLQLWEMARSWAERWPEEARLKFSIYTRVADLASFISEHLPYRPSPRPVWW